jgi:hypothetical protein
MAGPVIATNRSDPPGFDTAPGAVGELLLPHPIAIATSAATVSRLIMVVLHNEYGGRPRWSLDRFLRIF